MKLSLGAIRANVLKLIETYGGETTPTSTAASAAGYTERDLDEMLGDVDTAIIQHGIDYMVEYFDTYEDDEYPDWWTIHPGIVFWWARPKETA